jgi:hypothetical protein
VKAVPRQAFPSLGDPADLRARVGRDREVPRPPVLALDPTDARAADLDPESDLADHVLLHDAADLGPVGPRDDDRRLEDFPRPSEGELRRA